MTTFDTTHDLPSIRGRLNTIDLACPFIDELAQGLLFQVASAQIRSSLANTQIFLPTRRACQALREALLRLSPNNAILLPQMIPLGDVLEQQVDDDARTQVLSLQRRLLVLQLVEQWQRANRQKEQVKNSQSIPESNTEKITSAHIAVALTNSLTTLQDDLLLEEIDAHNLLQNSSLVPPSCAKHWHESVKFLQILTNSWPQLLKERALVEPTAERVENLNQLAEKIKSQIKADRKIQQLESCPKLPEATVIIAGSTGSVKATARLMRLVLALPNGQVILPGCPISLVQNEEMFKLANNKSTHPFHAFARLINAWNIPIATIASLLRPYTTIKEEEKYAPRKWRKQLLVEAMAERPDPKNCITSAKQVASLDFCLDTNLRLITCSDRQEEAEIIALLLREALEKKNTRAALITRDRQLARYVRARLFGQWGLRIEDTATYSLSSTVAARLFLLLLQAVTPERSSEQNIAKKSHEQLNKMHSKISQKLPKELPIDIFALKSTFALLGGDAANAWNIFEARILRRTARDQPRKTQRAARDLNALQKMLDYAATVLKPQQVSLIKSLLDSLATFANVAASSTSRAELLAAHRTLSETISDLCFDQKNLQAARDEEAYIDTSQNDSQGTPLDSALYSLEGGQALARLNIALTQHWQENNTQNSAQIPISIRAYRQTIEALIAAEAMPGSYASHPRLAILGPLEARLLSFERVILGSMVEGGWPAESDSSPFLPNPVREKIGLKNNDSRIGLSALDFLSFACSPEEIYITHAERLNGRPQPASRFVQRLETISYKHNNFRDQARESQLRAWMATLAQATNNPDNSGLLSCPSPLPKPSAPTPCVASNARPKRINLTSLADLINDPYTIYARQVLRLEPLEPLQQDAEQALYGSFIHKCFEEITKNFSNKSHQTIANLQSVIEQELYRYAPSPFIAAFWREPLLRSASLLVRRLSALAPQKIWSEVKGEYNVALENGRSITISARADLIVQNGVGDKIIIDHKTASIPSKKSLLAFEYPQLLIGAWMLQQGAFHPSNELKIALADTPHASYWRFSGKQGENATIDINEELLTTAKDKPATYPSLQEFYEGCRARYFDLLKHFDKPNTPYEARVLTNERARFDVYAHLARRRAWGQEPNDDEASDGEAEE